MVRKHRSRWVVLCCSGVSTTEDVILVESASWGPALTPAPYLPICTEGTIGDESELVGVSATGGRRSGQWRHVEGIRRATRFAHEAALAVRLAGDQKYSVGAALDDVGGAHLDADVACHAPFADHFDHETVRSWGSSRALGHQYGATGSGRVRTCSSPLTTIWWPSAAHVRTARRRGRHRCRTRWPRHPSAGRGGHRVTGSQAALAAAA
jgi:hypothetical protein